MAAILALIFLVPGGTRPATFQTDTVFVSEISFGSFDQATRLTIGPDGKIYIIDSQKNAVVTFKSPQDSPTVLGGYGWSATTFDRPSGIATDGLNIYISDYGNHRIQRFDRYSNLLSSLSTRDTSYAPARFGYPAGVALSGQGDLMILDSENLRIVEFSADSRYERTFGDLNAAEGKLQYPIKICSEGDEHIYALEKNKIVEFDFYGNFLRSFGQQLHSDIVGGQSTPSGIAVVCADTLYWYRADGVLQLETPLRSLLAEEPVLTVQDIAFYDGRLFVLTPHRCHIFAIKSVNR